VSDQARSDDLWRPLPIPLRRDLMAGHCSSVMEKS
jgi:hypothetical protein